METVKKAEKETMGKLLDIASGMLRVEEILHTLVTARTVRSDGAYRQYLMQKAELARLQLEVNEVIRNHDVCCPCGCSVSMKLRELNYFEHNDNRFLVRDCAEATSEWGTSLTGESLAFVEKLLLYSFVRTRDLFDK